MHPTRSLRHEYELYVEREIEDYKDSIPRSALLAIGDEAVASLREQAQTTLTELVLWEEVDRLIARRLRLPSFRAWRRRRLQTLAELRRPERWGLPADCAVARALRASAEGEHVLVAGVEDEGAAIYSAALGCAVTALEPSADAVDRILAVAEAAGLEGRVRAAVGDLGIWQPDVALRVVVCSPAAFDGLTVTDRERAIATLQSATLVGGVHLVRTFDDGRPSPTVDELRARYADWAISVEAEATASATFMARKAAVH